MFIVTEGITLQLNIPKIKYARLKICHNHPTGDRWVFYMYALVEYIPVTMSVKIQ